MTPIRPEILAKSNELAELCRRFGVKRLEIFGSAATDQFDPDRSDLDCLAEFEEITFRGYFGFIEALEALFGRHVDLLTPRSIHNRYLLASVNRTRTLIYAA
jgi:predicted nucleotidyltransferase